MIYKGPAIDVSEIALTPFVLSRAAEFGDKPALTDGVSGRERAGASAAQP